jgi:formylmethanofuran dehydrogenase subunit C
MTVQLKLKKEPDIPIEADSITPTHFAGKKSSEIGELPILQGNRTLKLVDYFAVSGEPGETADDTDIVITGNLSKFKMIGKEMNGGKITIEGDVGMHLGAEMIAGRIHVKGSVGPWAAAEMKGGNIQIEGDAGDYLCSGYRGSTDGMQGGRVYVAGNVGREMGSHMRKGFIAVKGNVGEGAAVRMKGGSIIVCGTIGDRFGVEATKGMLFALGKLESLLPTYKFSGTAEREFTSYYVRYLKDRRPDFVSEDILGDAKWTKFIGDFAEADPKEEIYVLTKNNEHLL